jgi:hypothetical protein
VLTAAAMAGDAVVGQTIHGQSQRDGKFHVASRIYHRLPGQAREVSKPEA